MKRQRTQMGSVIRRNGAWLITCETCPGARDGDTMPCDITDAAAALRTAKRRAEQIASEWGAEGPFRWQRELNGNLWHLLGYDVDDDAD